MIMTIIVVLYFFMQYDKERGSNMKRYHARKAIKVISRRRSGVPVGGPTTQPRAPRCVSVGPSPPGTDSCRVRPSPWGPEGSGVCRAAALALPPH